MKRIFILATMMLTLCSTLMAQDDDVYFIPKKNTEKASVQIIVTYEDEDDDDDCEYESNPRDVDEYNRHGDISSYYEVITNEDDADAVFADDIIEFEAGDGSYSENVRDTVYVVLNPYQFYDDDDLDYYYSRLLGLFDGYYGWYSPYLYAYWDWPYLYSCGWYSPWVYNWWCYNPLIYGHYGLWCWRSVPIRHYTWTGWHSSGHGGYLGYVGTTNHSNGIWHSSGSTLSYSGTRGVTSTASSFAANKTISTYNRTASAATTYSNAARNSQRVNVTTSGVSTMRQSVSSGMRSFSGSRGGMSSGGARSGGSFGGHR